MIALCEGKRNGPSFRPSRVTLEIFWWRKLAFEALFVIAMEVPVGRL